VLESLYRDLFEAFVLDAKARGLCTVVLCEELDGQDIPSSTSGDRAVRMEQVLVPGLASQEDYDETPLKEP